MQIAKFQLEDGRIAKFEVPDNITPEQAFNLVSPQLNELNNPKKQEVAAPTTAAIPERTYGEVAKDVGAAVATGLGGLGQFPGQLYGLATGDFSDTGLYGKAKELEKYGESLKSPGLVAREKATQARIAEAEKEGQISSFFTTIKEIITDPVQLPNFLISQSIQSIPSIAAALVPLIGTAASAEIKALQIAAKTATSVAAREIAEKQLKDYVADVAIKTGTKQAVRVGAVQQGADIGTGAYEDIYSKLISQNVPEDQAAERALGLARSAGASGAVISFLAQNLPGARVLEERLAGMRFGSPGGVGGNIASRVAGGVGVGLKEGLTEIPEEVGGKFSQNLAMQQVDPTQALAEGLGATGGQAFVGGFGLGTVIGSLTHGDSARIAEEKRNIDQAKLQTQKEQALEQALKQQNLTKTQLGITEEQQQLGLPAPDELFKQTVNPLFNPFGNYSAADLGINPEVDAYVKQHRQLTGKPTIESYSIEDIQDAMPGTNTAGEKAAIDSFLTAKTGYTPEVTYTAQDIQNVATQKNIETKTKGFDDFLTRTTGISNVAEMSQPQFHAAFTALSNLPKSPDLQILPQGTNATRFTEDQYKTSIESLKAVGNNLSREDALNKIYDQIKVPYVEPVEPIAVNKAPDVEAEQRNKTYFENLQRKNAESILSKALRQNDLETVKVPKFDVIAPDGSVTVSPLTRESAERIAEKTEGFTVKESSVDKIAVVDQSVLPKGFDIQQQSFKQDGVPAGYQIKAGNVLISPTAFTTEEEATNKVKSYEAVRTNQIKAIDKQLTKLETEKTTGQNELDAMEVSGSSSTPAYRVASAAFDNQVRGIDTKVVGLNRQKELLAVPLQIIPTGSAIRSGFTVFEQGIPKATLPTKQAAEEHIIANASDETLQNISTSPTPNRLRNKATEEINRRAGKVEPGIRVARSPELEEQAVVENQAQMAKLEETLKPILAKFGLNTTKLKIVKEVDGGKGEASYSGIENLINLAFDAVNPVRALRHESVHALKELGFFTDGQWKALVNQANTKWINKYLKQKNVSGNPLAAGEQSRYEAYMKAYAGDQEAIIEEAIADAFADFDVNGAPAGFMAALLTKIQNFFKALLNSLNGAGFQTAEDVFGKVERGELRSTVSSGAQTKFSLKPNPEVEKAVAAKINLTTQESAATSLGLQTGKPKQKQFSNQKIGGLPEVVQFLQDRRIASGLKPLDINDKEDRTTLAKLLTAEAVSAIYSGGNALAWYNETIARMMGMASLKFPELLTDRNAQMAFKLSTAITSQGLNVEDNLAFSMKQYQKYAYNKRLNGIGQFDEIGQGADEPAMISNFKLANRMLKEYGEDTTRKFLETEFLTEELRAAGFKITGELGDEKITGSSIFGPKIGFGFYSNLNGNFEPVTMDMWFMRLVGRLTGSLRKFDPELFEKQLSRFRNAFIEEGENGVYANDFSKEALEKARTNETSAINFARVVNSVFSIDFKNNRELYNEGIIKKTELVYSAQQILGAVDSPRDAPSNGTERRQLRDVVNQTVDMISEIQGQRIPPAALQALIWYPEQELYSTLGVKLRVTSQDYAGAIKKILLKEKYSEQSISAASKSGARQLQQMANQPVGQKVGQLSQKPQAAFTTEERSEFLEQARTKTVIEQERKEPKRKKVVFEVAPDPSNIALTESWNNLDQDTRLKISEGIARKIVRKVLVEFDLEGSFTSQVGSFLEDTNPSFALFLESGDAVEVSKFIGHVLSQKSMVVISPKEAKGVEKVGAITLDVKTQDPKIIDEIYQRLRNIRVNGKQPIGGQSTMNGKMILLNFSNVATEDLAHLIDHQLNGDYNVLIGDVYAAFPEKESYDYVSPSNDPRGKGGDLRQRSRALRNEATQQLRDELFKIRQQQELATGKQDNIATSPAAKAAANLKNVVTDKTLFEAQTELNQYDENLFNDQVTDAQRSRAEKALIPYMKLAEQEKPAFDAEVERIAKDVGVQARLDPIKNIVRSAEKLVLETENGTKKPNGSLILDLLRATIVVNTEAEIPNAIKQIEKLFDVIRVKDRFQNPALTGYRDFLVNVKLPSGLIAEIQVNIPAMIGSKSTGHKLYRMSRNMEQRSSNRMYLEDLSRRLYDEAYRFSQNSMSAASARDALLRKESDGKARSGSAAKTSEPSLSSKTGVASTAQTLAPSGTSNIQTPNQNISIPKYSLRAAPNTPEFKQWFGNSKVVDKNGEPMVMYHGTARDITEFRPKQANAIFLTKNPKFANDFSSLSKDYLHQEFWENSSLDEKIEILVKVLETPKLRMEQVLNPVEYKTLKKDITDASLGFGPGIVKSLDNIMPFALRIGVLDEINLKLPTNENIMPVYVSAQNPFDYENSNHVQQVVDELNKTFNSTNYGQNIGDKEKNYIARGNWVTIENQFTQKAIRNLGFDGFYVEEGKQKNLAVYKSSQIKSAIGNTGAYDANNPDIRYSIKQVKEIFKKAEKIQEPPGVESIREQWIGGVAGVGNRESMYDLYRVNGSKKYVTDVQNFICKELGNNFKGYRLMSNDELEELQTASMGSQFVSFTLNSEIAKAFKNIPDYANEINMSIIEMDLTPEHVVMIGHPGEQELVVDYGQGYNPEEIKIVKKYSLRKFKSEDLPKEQRKYNLPANTLIFHGSHGSAAAKIEESGRVLLTYPGIKSSGGTPEEGGLIFFGSADTANNFAQSLADPYAVESARKRGEIRSAGTVFQTVTDRSYKLMDRYQKLTAAEANALNDALGIPDYKYLRKGDNANRAASLADSTPRFTSEKVKRTIIKRGEYDQVMSSPWPVIFKTLEVDGFYDNRNVPSIALTSDNGIRLVGKDNRLEKFSLTQKVNSLPNSSKILDSVNKIISVQEQTGHVERMVAAFSPKSRSNFRAAFIDRYNQIGVNSKQVAKLKGKNWLLADVSAEAAANMSDLATGVSASALGVGQGKGGIPVYANGFTKVFNDDGKIKGAVEIFSTLAKYNNPEIYRMYQWWAGSLRGKRLLDEGREYSYTRDDIKLAEELLVSFPEFEQVQKEWIVYNDGLVKYAVDTGVLTKEAGEKFREYGDYIPFYRQIDGEQTVGPNIFSGISGVKGPKTLKGNEKSEAPLADFLETIVRNTQSIIESGMKNVAAERAVRDAVILGQAEKLNFQPKEFKSDVVSYQEKGRTVYYKLADPALYEAMKGLNIPDMPWLGILSAPANLLRTLVTKDPGFMLVNLMRDSVSAWVTSGSSMTPIVDTMNQFVKTLAGKSPEAQALMMSGVLGGYDFASNVESGGKDLAKYLRKKTNTKTTTEFLATPFTSIWEALEKGTTASDAATRAAIYRRVMDETGNEAEAIYRALEVLNFNRKGNAAVVRILTAIVPFLNARIQGLDVLYRASFGEMASKDAKAIQKAFLVRGLFLMGMTALYYAATADDEEYQKQEQEVRDNNWLIPSLGIKIPIPFEIGVLFKVIPERIMAYHYGTDTGADLLKSASRNIVSTFAFNPVPQAIIPFVETATNYSFFTGREIVPRELKDVSPEFQTNAGTSGLAKRISSGLADILPSGLKEKALSPIQIDHIVNGYTGTLGMYASSMLNSVFDRSTDPTRADLRLEQMPVLRRILIDKEAKGNATAYYDLKHSTDTMVRTINLLEKTQNFEELGKYQQENLNLLATQDYMKDLAKMMKELNEYSVMIKSSQMDGASKRDALLAISQAQNNVTANIKTIRKMLN